MSKSEPREGLVVEVTSAMIEAGRQALVDFGLFGLEGVEDLLRAVYAEMPRIEQSGMS